MPQYDFDIDVEVAKVLRRFEQQIVNKLKSEYRDEPISVGELRSELQKEYKCFG